MKKFYIILLASLVMNITKAQQWTSFTNPNTIQAIAIDSNGDKWFGTTGGISFFDGTNWTVYNKSTNSQIENIVNAIAFDSAGNKWFGTAAGILKFDGSVWTSYTKEDGLVASNVKTIAIDKFDNKWIGTEGGGVSMFDGTTWTSYTSADGLADRYVFSIAIDSSDNKWFGTNAGVSKFDGTNWTTYTTADGLAANWITSIKIDSEGIIWFGTSNGGISKFDGINWTNFYDQSSNFTYISCIDFDADNNKWFGTNSGVFKYDDENWEHYTVADGLAYDVIRSIAIDSSGNKWFGTYGYGISKFDDINWITYEDTNCVANNNVRFITIDNQNNKWFGTINGVSRYDDTIWTTYRLGDGLVNDWVNAIAIDSLDNKWFGTGGGVSEFDGISWTNYTKDDGLLDNFVNAVAVDTLGNKWFGTNAGVSKLNGTTWTNYTTSEGLTDNFVQSIAVDSLNNIWVGGIGVSVFDGTSWTQYTTNDGLIDDRVNSIKIDKQGIKWFGTYEGISKFDGTTWINYNTAHHVDAIVIDSENNKWIGTEGGGVLMFDDTNWTSYTSEDGLPYNYVWSIAIDRNDNKWFGLMSGISDDSKKKGTNPYSGSSGGVSRLLKGILSVSQTALSISAEANSTVTFDITSNTNWQVTTDKSWLTVDSPSGSDSLKVTLLAMENHITIQRSATVTISGVDTDSITIYVTQEEASPVLSVSQSIIDIAAEENSTVSFDIVSNTSWEVNSDKTWLRADVLSGSDSLEITLNAFENLTTEPRIATVTISGIGVESKTISITQEGGSPVLSVSKTLIDIAAEENSTASFNIVSNTKWQVSSDQTWISADISSGSDSLVITLEAFENLTSESRTATVTISGIGIDSKTISVTQAGATPVLSVSANNLDIAAEENSTVNFEITSNTDWNIVCDMTWITLSSSNGANNGSITITAVANPTVVERVATITISGNGFETETITLTQAAGNIGIIDVTGLDIFIYPNPASAVLYFNKLLESETVLISDMSGQIVLIKKIIENKIDISSLNNGIYILTIDCTKNQIIRKLVIE